MQTLQEAKDWLRGHLDEGASCPCCTQFAKIYKRRIHSAIAREFLAFYRMAKDGQFHKPANSRSGDFSILQYWKIIEQAEKNDLETEDQKYSGLWRITPLGVAFALGRVSLPKYARIYDGRLLKLQTDELADIKDCLGKKFSYRELMGMEFE